MKQKCSKQDLLINGSISKALIWFALPLLGSSFIQLLYNAVDLIFIGNYVGKSASAAVGSGSLLLTCLVGFITGISVGAGVVVAQYYGDVYKRQGVPYMDSRSKTGMANVNDSAFQELADKMGTSNSDEYADLVADVQRYYAENVPAKMCIRDSRLLFVQ